jgi:type I restriction enzyme M protein
MHQYHFATREVDWLNPKSVASERPNQDTEVLFIEQCWKYLAEGGYLAIVIPDGILTNSSLQYVRDGIEDLFRIVAVVSLPQTAFTATGAGVKSSVLFLKKLTVAQTQLMRDTKQTLKDSIREQEHFEDALYTLEREKKKALAELLTLPDYIGMNKAEIRQTESYKDRSKEINERFAAEVEDIRYRLSETYEERRRKRLPDYDILMAIAEDIGYDATGRLTKTNELVPIAHELRQFIESIEETKA